MAALPSPMTAPTLDRRRVTGLTRSARRLRCCAQSCGCWCRTGTLPRGGAWDREMSLIIDTSQVAPSERFDLWVEEASKAYFPMSFERGGGSAFSGRRPQLRARPGRRPPGDGGTVGAAADTADHRRCGPGDVPSRARAARPQPDGAGRQVVRDADGNAVRLPELAPFVIRNETDFEMLVISFPMALLGQFAGRVCARTGERIDQTFASRFVAPFLIDLAASDRGRLARPRAERTSGRRCVDVVALDLPAPGRGNGDVPARRRAAPAGDDLHATAISATRISRRRASRPRTSCPYDRCIASGSRAG